ncbi:MAG: spore protease YyaC [Syntrophomonadaceae bacterium]
MVFAEVYHQQDAALTILIKALTAALEDSQKEPMFVFIGTDRHILDCFGPLTGSMLSSRVPELIVYGTLDRPLHAQNLVSELKYARQTNGDRIVVAVDASAGREDEIGLIRIKRGGIVPGKALARNLPTVGQIAVTGIVDIKHTQQGTRVQGRPGLALVYNMAGLLSGAISEWYRIHYPVTERRI